MKYRSVVIELKALYHYFPIIRFVFFSVGTKSNSLNIHLLRLFIVLGISHVFRAKRVFFLRELGFCIIAATFWWAPGPFSLSFRSTVLKPNLWRCEYVNSPFYCNVQATLRIHLNLGGFCEEGGGGRLGLKVPYPYPYPYITQLHPFLSSQGYTKERRIFLTLQHYRYNIAGLFTLIFAL